MRGLTARTRNQPSLGETASGFRQGTPFQPSRLNRDPPIRFCLWRPFVSQPDGLPRLQPFQPAATKCLSWVESLRYNWRTMMNDWARLAAIASATAASMLWALAAFSQSPPNRDSCDRALSLREPAINAAHQVVDQCMILCRQVVVQEQKVGAFWEMCIRQGQANAQRPNSALCRPCLRALANSSPVKIA